MTSREFCYWLQGHFELNDSEELTPNQVGTIRSHLDLVFYHEIDKSYSDDPKVQQKMNEIHSSAENKMRC